MLDISCLFFKWSRERKTFENEVLEESKEDRTKDLFQTPLGMEYCMSTRKDPFQTPLGLEYCKSTSSSTDDDDSFDDSWSDKDYKNPLHRNLGIETIACSAMRPGPFSMQRPRPKRPLLTIYDNKDVNANGILEREGIPPPPPPPSILLSIGGKQPQPPPSPPTSPSPPL